MIATKSPSFSSKVPGQTRRRISALLDALDGGLAVLDRVAGAGMEEAVVAAGRAGGDLAALHERHAEAAEDEVVGERAAGAAAAHDRDVVRLAGKSRDRHLLRSAPGECCPGPATGARAGRMV